jgi:hypothetical protein
MAKTTPFWAKRRNFGVKGSLDKITTKRVLSERIWKIEGVSESFFVSGDNGKSVEVRGYMKFPFFFFFFLILPLPLSLGRPRFHSASLSADRLPPLCTR